LGVLKNCSKNGATKLFTDDIIWLLDRFHFSEWVISKSTRREAYPGSEWAFYEAGLQKIDERMQEQNTLMVLVTASPWMVEKRQEKLKKQDPVGSPQQAQYWWLNTIHKTTCDMIHVVNDRTNQLDRLVNMLADICAVRWSRYGAKAKSMVETAEEEMEAKITEVTEDEDRPAPLGPGDVESAPELSGGSEVDETSDDIPF
jgi:hypothetical protein